MDAGDPAVPGPHRVGDPGPAPAGLGHPAAASPWGVGTDIVPVARIRSLAESPRALRWFHDSEIDYCMGKAHPERHLAGRIAAKEAIFKALGQSGHGPVPWLQIEVRSVPRQAPQVVLHGQLRKAATAAGIAVRVSISHCDDYATATALAYPATVAPGTHQASGSPQASA